MLEVDMSNSVMHKRGSLEVKKLVYLAILTALVCVLQVVSNVTAGILPVPITLTLVPIVMGAAICDKWSGAWLGAAFAAVTIFSGAAEPFLTLAPFGTVVTVFAKSILAGIASGLAYSLIEKKNRYIAIIAAGAVAPIVNTGIFVAGCYLFFYDYVASLAGGEAMFPFIITVFVGVNFLIELALNMLLAPTILRLVNIRKRA